MKMNKEDMKKIMFLIVFAIIIFWLSQNLNFILNIINGLFKLLFPFILGLCIAFVLNVPMSLIENKIFKKKNKYSRVLAITLSLALLVVILFFVLFLVIPSLIETITSFANKFPFILENIKEWLEKILIKYPELQSEIDKINFNSAEINNLIMNFAKSSIKDILNTSVSLISTLISSVANLFMGIVFSIYILSQKEILSRQAKKVLYAFLPNKIVNKFLEITEISNNTFSKFITGQCLEACILGLMFFVSLSIFKFPYALTLSVLVIVTALIPIFGAMIAMFIGVILIMVNDPVQAIWFVVLFQILQQIEGNLIYPKVVGKQVGLPPIWVMLAVIVGGSAFGLIGMLVSVPISSILYTLFKNWVNDRLDYKIKLSKRKKV